MNIDFIWFCSEYNKAVSDGGVSNIRSLIHLVILH